MAIHFDIVPDCRQVKLFYAMGNQYIGQESDRNNTSKAERDREQRFQIFDAADLEQCQRRKQQQPVGRPNPKSNPDKNSSSCEKNPWSGLRSVGRNGAPYTRENGQDRKGIALTHVLARTVNVK